MQIISNDTSFVSYGNLSVRSEERSRISNLHQLIKRSKISNDFHPRLDSSTIGEDRKNVIGNHHRCDIRNIMMRTMAGKNRELPKKFHAAYQRRCYL